MVRPGVCLLIFCLLLAIALPLTAQSSHKKKKKKGMQGYAVGKLQVAPDLYKRMARYKAVPMPPPAGLSAREQQMLDQLVEACHSLEDIFWRQSDLDALTLYQALAGRKLPRDVNLRHFVFINASRFDLLDQDRPFIGTEAMPPGRGLYPSGLTRAQIEDYVERHPEKKAEIYSPYTVLRRRGDALEGIPYRIAYRSFLEPAAQALRQAADLSDDKAFADFLRMRADALLSDQYFDSDLKWLDLKEPKFDLIFAPYETYLDGVLGIKTSYGAAVLVRNDKESAKLRLYEKYVAAIQDALPLPEADRPSKRGLATPMEVVDAPFRAGDLRHGYQAVADNLPNDPEIHKLKGSKKIFFKNFMDARVKYVIVPVAHRMMRLDQADLVSAEGYMAGTLMHEISHGLGPAFSRVNGQQVDTREAIGPLYGALEEAKADIVGLWGLKWLIDQGVLPGDHLNEYYAAQLADIFRTVRFGIGEAHAHSEIMEFNYLSAEGAIVRDPASHRYHIEFARMPDAVASLAKELLEIEATGDRRRAEAWFAKYDSMPMELKSALNSANDVPVDIDPVFSYPEPIQ